MIHPGNDLENILEMEMQEQQLEKLEANPLDQYGTDKMWQTYQVNLERMEDDLARQEIEGAVDRIQEPQQMIRTAETQIEPVEDQMEVIEMPDNSPEILAYFDGRGRRIPMGKEP